MSMSTTLTELATASLKKLGATQNLTSASAERTAGGTVLTADDRWGDRWAVLVTDDVANAEVAELLAYKEDASRLVLGLPKADESAGREKLREELGGEQEDGSKHAAPSSVLVWAL